jgi:hypothetical protein
MRIVEHKSIHRLDFVPVVGAYAAVDDAIDAAVDDAIVVAVGGRELGCCLDVVDFGVVMDCMELGCCHDAAESGSVMGCMELGCCHDAAAFGQAGLRTEPVCAMAVDMHPGHLGKTCCSKT